MSDNLQPQGIGAKQTSLIGMIVGAVWVAGWSAFKFITRPELMTVQDVIYSGLALAAIFMPVYFSIMLDKIRDIKLGGEK